MRGMAAIILASSLLASQAFASDVQTQSSLPAGKPAGVQNAQLGGNGFLLLAGIAIVAGGIALVASSGNNGNTVAVTTTTTAP